MANTLFHVENGVVEINKTWVKQVPEFAYILHRSRGIKGDSVGRDRLFAYMEFHFIFLMEDSDSPFIEYPEKERRNLAMHESGLDSVTENNGKLFGWRQDDEVKAARKKYDELSNTIMCKILINLKQGLQSANKSLIHLNENVNNVSEYCC